MDDDPVLLEVKGGTARVLAATKALVITWLVQGWGGDVLLGTLPAGEVMRWSGGKLSTLVKLPGVECVDDGRSIDLACCKLSFDRM